MSTVSNGEVVNEAVIGDNAGKVWNALSQKGSQTLSNLSRQTNLKPQEVDKAIGWLAREGKLEFDGEKVAIKKE